MAGRQDTQDNPGKWYAGYTKRIQDPQDIYEFQSFINQSFSLNGYYINLQ